MGLLKEPFTTLMATESKSRLGTYVTTTVTGEPVQAFIPPRLPPNPPVELAGLYQHLDRANQALGRLDGLTTLLPDTKFFLICISEKRRCCRPRSRGRNRRFRIYCCLRMTQSQVFRLMMSKRYQITSPRCNMAYDESPLPRWQRQTWAAADHALALLEGGLARTAFVPQPILQNESTPVLRSPSTCPDRGCLGRLAGVLCGRDGDHGPRCR